MSVGAHLRHRSAARPDHPRELTDLMRRRGLAVILAGNFLMWAGFFMLVPLLSVHYVDGLGWTGASIGLVLAVRQLVEQSLTLPGGVLADRIGARALITGGLLVRALGFATMAWADSLQVLLVSALLAAAGGGMFNAPRSAAIATLTTPENRSRYYSLAGVVGGLGMTAGPLIGAVLLGVDFAFVALTSAACYVVAAGLTLALLPRVRVAVQSQRMTAGLRLALHDRRFMTFTALLTGYWFMTVQLTISLPLVARQLSGQDAAVGWIYGLNAAMTVCLQYPLIRFTERRLSPLATLITGMVMMAVSLGAVGLAGGIETLLGCVALFSLANLLTAPSQQTVAADYADPAALGSYFGVNALAVAVGGGIGNLSGGLLHDLGAAWDLAALPWAVFATVGLGAASGMLALHVRHRRPSWATAPT